jgi:hypothetical protein
MERADVPTFVPASVRVPFRLFRLFRESDGAMFCRKHRYLLLAALPECLSNHVRCPRASVSACFGGDNGLDPSSRAIIDALRINTADLVDDEEKKRS